ncbi:MAG: SUMF1/EgtB/PvdO family nonheme iron enzyme [Desulfobacterales bacterium]|nr:SUMF1/EgtB/PvdO family nonheme iron enzyme [Desulfobacterales bacterium]
MIQKFVRLFFVIPAVIVAAGFSSAYAEWTDINGKITAEDGTFLCAMVLANGQHMFSCDPEGEYNLNVPLNDEGQIDLQVFCDGFSSFKETLEPDAGNFDVTMLPASPDSAEITLTTVFDIAVRNPGWIKISGTVRSEDDTDLCTMVLANGQHMFTCGEDNEGIYEMEVPANAEGKIELFSFCDGFLQFKRSFDTADIDIDGDGYKETQGDCNDNDASVYPGAGEILNDGIDQDCNGSDLIGDDTFTNSLAMIFNLIPAGTFMMGNEVYTQHQVTLTKAYYLQTTEVTHGQWKAVMGENPSHFSDCGDNCPVDSVSWDDVQEFIAELNKKGEGIYRLPTEAEWEYAARAGTTTPFAFGDCLSTDQANYDGNQPLNDCEKGERRFETVPAASFQPNDWGLYNMHGNVFEWCHDWYGGYPASAVTDPTGPSTGSRRIIRGGSWNFAALLCQSAFHFGFSPGERSRSFGFRLALSQGSR